MRNIVTIRYDQIKNYKKKGYIVIDTTSRGMYAKDLSPFCLRHPDYPSVLIENFWQYSKFYELHGNIIYHEDGMEGFQVPGSKETILLPRVRINEVFRMWANQGMEQAYANRHPVKKGFKPVCSILVVGKKYYACDYIQARKMIYAPAYARAVVKTDAYRVLVQEVLNGRDIALIDFDAVDISLGWEHVLNDPSHIMGHSAVLAALLSGEYKPE